MRPRKRIKRKARNVGEFFRVYGGIPRTRWVSLLPCVCCQVEGTVDHPNANHHTENGGLSKKAHYTTIVSLCHYCHNLHHTGELGRSREWWIEQARLTEEQWRGDSEEVDGSADFPPDAEGAEDADP